LLGSPPCFSLNSVAGGESTEKLSENFHSMPGFVTFWSHRPRKALHKLIVGQRHFLHLFPSRAMDPTSLGATVHSTALLQLWFSFLHFLTYVESMIVLQMVTKCTLIVQYEKSIFLQERSQQCPFSGSLCFNCVIGLSKSEMIGEVQISLNISSEYNSGRSTNVSMR